MTTVCDFNNCCACKACMAVCKKKAVTTTDGISHFSSRINSELCIDCGLCREICIANSKHDDDASEPILWKQGWAMDENVRASSASGGAAAAVSKAFIKHGGAVCGCCYSDGVFKFKIAHTENELGQFAGSKYVKSDPDDIYSEIKNELATGKKVLFIGLPCQVEAVKRYCRNYAENLYVMDLICHGSPSPEILKAYLLEKGIKLKSISDIGFRKKNDFRLYKKNSGNKEFCALEPFQDLYLDAFLSGTIFTENCYSCKFANLNRVGDVTLGDSWDSDLPEDEVKKGISLIMCRNEKGAELLNMAQLHLEDVNVQKAINANEQLKHPFVKPDIREKFFSVFLKTGSFKKAYFHAFPSKYIKHSVKLLLYRLHIYRGGRYVNDMYGIALRLDK